MIADIVGALDLYDLHRSRHVPTRSITTHESDVRCEQILVSLTGKWTIYGKGRSPPQWLAEFFDDCRDFKDDLVRNRIEDWYEKFERMIQAGFHSSSLAPRPTLAEAVGAELAPVFEVISKPLRLIRTIELWQSSASGEVPQFQLAAPLIPRTSLPVLGTGGIEIVEVMELESMYWADTQRLSLAFLERYLDGGHVRVRPMLFNTRNTPESRRGAALVEYIARHRSQDFWDMLGCGFRVAMGTPWKSVSSAVGLDLSEAEFDQLAVTERLTDGYDADTRMAMLCGLPDAPPVFAIGRDVYYMQYGREIDRLEAWLDATLGFRPPEPTNARYGVGAISIPDDRTIR